MILGESSSNRLKTPNKFMGKNLAPLCVRDIMSLLLFVLLGDRRRCFLNKSVNDAKRQNRNQQKEEEKHIKQFFIYLYIIIIEVKNLKMS